MVAKIDPSFVVASPGGAIELGPGAVGPERVQTLGVPASPGAGLVQGPTTPAPHDVAPQSGRRAGTKLLPVQAGVGGVATLHQWRSSSP